MILFKEYNIFKGLIRNCSDKYMDGKYLFEMWSMELVIKVVRFLRCNRYDYLK